MARFDLVASRRAAWMAWAWLALACGVMWFAALPGFIRSAACIGLATVYGACVRSVIQLRGRNAIRALGWTRDGALLAWLGGDAVPRPAMLVPGSLRLGRPALFLTLRTDVGRYSVLVDGSAQDPAAFRALCRRLRFRNRTRSGAAEAQADTMRRKV